MIKKNRSPTYRATQKLFDCQAGRREGPVISIISQEPHAVCGPLYGVLWVRLGKKLHVTMELYPVSSSSHCLCCCGLGLVRMEKNNLEI